MHLAGVTSPYRYLLYFLPWTLMVMGTILKLDLWMSTTHSVQKMVVDDGGVNIVRVIIRSTLLAILFAAMVLIGTILPIVYYEDKWALNWFYTFFIFTIAFVSTFAVIATAALNYTLAKKCEGVAIAGNESNLAPLVTKLKETVKAALGIAFVTTIILFFPLWMGLTQTASDPGMQGHFYFHYIFYQLFNFLGVFVGIWNLAQAKKTGNTSGSSELKTSSGPKDSVRKESNTSDASTAARTHRLQSIDDNSRVYMHSLDPYSPFHL